jgi:mannose-6-phosphate isomerase-like protein (cupin superfamily)
MKSWRHEMLEKAVTIKRTFEEPLPPMSREEYEKFIVYQTDKCLIHMEDPWPEAYSINSIKSAPIVIPNASSLSAVWIDSPKVDEVSFKPHWHNVDEYCLFIGGNPKDRYNLNAVLEWYFHDQKFTITRTCAVYIPAGVLHSPFVFPKVDLPVLHVDVLLGACNITDDPTRHVRNDDPQWAAFRPYPEFLDVDERDI